jgi:hypothetical protein
VPGGVGIVIKGVAICLVAEMFHAVLGVDIPSTVVGAALSGAGLFAIDRAGTRLARRVRER